MYKVAIGGKEREVEATGISVENGTIVFFHDEDCKLSRFVVAAGKWDSLEVLGDSDALQIRPPAQVSVQPEAGSSGEVCEGHQEEAKEQEVLEGDAAEGI